MARTGRRAGRYENDREATEAREAIERRWRDRLIEEPKLAALVTAQGAPDEPFHRWVHFKQGFSPGLVRLFLREHGDRLDRSDALPVLDPFAGSGTCVIECARRGVRAIGIEALEALTFLVNVRNERELPLWPGSPKHVNLIPGGMPALKAGMLDGSEDMAAREAAMPLLPPIQQADDWRSIAPFLTHPLHRAALMLAEGRRHTSTGRLNRGADPLPKAIAEVLAMIREDLLCPLPMAVVTQHGDARRLTMIEGASISGILTSPPYLSRHDYASIAAPYERVYRHWFMSAEPDAPYSSQMAGRVGSDRRRFPPSQGGIEGGSRDRSIPEAAREAATQLETVGEPKLARVVREYFVDFAQVLAECHRVLTPGGGCWVVLGGARIKDVHIPSDIIAAEQAASLGFRVEAVRVAREVTNSRRKFGRIGHLAPRESVIVMTRR